MSIIQTEAPKSRDLIVNSQESQTHELTADELHEVVGGRAINRIEPRYPPPYP